jgi:site-specific DNA-methyltransferase (adenine-specific)
MRRASYTLMLVEQNATRAGDRRPRRRPGAATDCFNVFAALKANSVDCVFADPPFNLGKKYGDGFSDDLERREYLKWSRAWMDECVRLLKPAGTMFVYILPQWGYHLAAHLEDRGMTFRHWIALSMKGTFPRGRKLYPAHYAILYFTKGQPATFNRVRLPVPACRHCGRDIKDYGGHRKYLNPAGFNLTDFWEDTAPARHQKFKSRWHVNELKPMIPARCLEVATTRGDVGEDRQLVRAARLAPPVTRPRLPGLPAGQAAIGDLLADDLAQRRYSLPRPRRRRRDCTTARPARIVGRSTQCRRRGLSQSASRSRALRTSAGRRRFHLAAKRARAARRWARSSDARTGADAPARVPPPRWMKGVLTTTQR